MFDVNGLAGTANFMTINQGKAGVVENCSLKLIEKKEGDHVNAPAFKLSAIDSEQLEAIKNGFDVEKVYGAEMAIYDTFKSDKQGEFAGKAMYYLLTQVDHPVSDKELLDFGTTTFKDIAAFINYGAKFIKNALTINKDWKFTVAIDFGTANYPKSMLQINGWPNPLKRSDKPGNIQNRQDALMQRPPKPDQESLPFEPSTATVITDDAPGW